jgi:membrane-associated protease RseP (regulator of RpoE activity)
MEFGIITAILVIVIYTVIVFLLWKAGILDRLNISAFGPLLMWRTKRGLKVLDRAARHDRFGRGYGKFSIGLCLFFMGLFTIILLWEAPLALRIPVASAPGPEYIIGLPGINPLIPLGYGIVALAIAIMIHEFAHGVLLRIGKVSVKSAGLLLFVIPIGAFVEQDEEELKKISRKHRVSMYAAGPASNLILAFVCAAIFCWGFMGSVTPVDDGVLVTSVVKDSPAWNASIRPYSLITAIALPNSTLDPEVTSESKFLEILGQSQANDTVTVTFMSGGATHVKQTTLWNKYDYYRDVYKVTKEEYRDKGFLGIGSVDASVLPQTLSRPMSYDSVEKFVGSAIYFIGLPILGLMPLKAPLTDIYTVSGPMAGLPPDAFWILANTFYWLFWLNLMVGATNSLPIPRMDGGMVYRDCLNAVFARLRPGWKEEKRERVARLGYRITGLMIVFLIVWQFLGPRVGALIYG